MGNRLESVRADIDKVDLEIVSLLNKRLWLAISATTAKLAESEPVLDRGREKQVIENICRANEGPMTDDQLIELYLNLMAQSRQLQNAYRADPASVTGKAPVTGE